MTREEKLQQFAEQNTKGLHLDRHNLIQMVKQGAEWADQHPQWIPVEEELPKKMANIFSMMRFLDTKCQYIMMGLLLCHQSPTGCRFRNHQERRTDYGFY